MSLKRDPFTETSVSTVPRSDFMIPLAILGIGIASAIVCYVVADRRGANAFLWGVMGFLFGPFALPFVLLVRRKPHDEEKGK